MPNMENMTFKLENFEGPLDLLLALISKNKMDLHDIPILELIDQYTSLVNQYTSERLDLASSFIEMAARLVEMKSYLLLPRSEEGERMKQELTGQLIEYDLCKRMASKLSAMASENYKVVRRPLEVEQDLTYNLHHDPSLLLKAWSNLMGRGISRKAPSPERFEPIVTAPVVSVSSRIVHVLRGLVAGRLHNLRQLFPKNNDRSTTVATFLAVLELVRHGRLTINDNEDLVVNRGKLSSHKTVEDSEWT